jgi:NAD+ synthase (glutamine-hydrolysing)
MKQELIVGAASLNQTPLDWDGNTSRILSAIEEAQKNGIDLLCLPEMAITGYGCEDWFLAEWVRETCLATLNTITEKCENITVLFSIPCFYKDDLYNVAVVIQNKEIIAFIPKQILANTGVYYESRWFKAWKPGAIEEIKLNNTIIPFGDTLFTVKGWKCGIEICEDAWHNNRPGFKHCENGAEIILNPSASHFAFGKSETRRDLVKTSSKNLNCIYVYSNLLGNESGRLVFDGEL